MKLPAYAKQSVGKPWEWDAAQTYDFILFMANTGLRPDEAKRFQHRDVAIADDVATDERLLEIQVGGKVGYGPCKSMLGAVRVYERLPIHKGPADEDSVFCLRIS